MASAWLADSRPAGAAVATGGWVPRRRAVTTGLTFARSHKSWRTPLFASVLLAAGALVLVLAVVGIGGG